MWKKVFGKCIQFIALRVAGLINLKLILYSLLRKFRKFSHILNDISFIYVNRGPGSFAGIRNSLSVVKAINLALKIDYYCYSLQDFDNQSNFKYENIPDLCNKFNIKKNFINPVYVSYN